MINSYEIAKVMRTENYDMFKRMVGNRKPTGWKAIVESIGRVGYVMSPILVNENMEVVDGQNRLEALKVLGLPVDYIIVEGVGVEACRSMNIGQKNWTFTDFLRSYSEDGNQNYTRLLGLIATYQKDVCIDGVLCANPKQRIISSGGAKYPHVRDGEYILDQESAYACAKCIEEIKKLGFVDFCNNRNMSARIYWRAVMYCYRHPEVNMERLIKQLNDNAINIKSYSSVIDQLRCFEEVYNFHLASDKRVYFATDFQRNLYNEVTK